MEKTLASECKLPCAWDYRDSLELLHQPSLGPEECSKFQLISFFFFQYKNQFYFYITRNTEKMNILKVPFTVAFSCFYAGHLLLPCCANGEAIHMSSPSQDSCHSTEFSFVGCLVISIFDGLKKIYDFVTCPVFFLVRVGATFS